MGKREIIYLSPHCHHQNDSCIKMGSDESHFNVSVGSDGRKSQDSVHKPQRRAEAVSNRGPSAYQPNALPLGQTGSHLLLCDHGPIYVHDVTEQCVRVQELSVLMSLTVSVDVKQH